MPTYDYKCRNKKCRKVTAVFQLMSAKPLSRCPKCRTGRVDRLIGSGSGLIFKGTGFYVTDYKKSGGDKNKDGKGGKDGGSEGSSSKSDKK